MPNAANDAAAASNAARYAARRASSEDPSPDAGQEQQAPMSLNAENKAAFIETAIQLAIRRGEFDNLPGAGKPLEGLGTHHDPEWWVRRKIEAENLTGLGPAAFLLRTEDQKLNERLDRLTREAEVREVLTDFNRRVIEARRQLQGGPPVVTPPRNIDTELVAWAERRANRIAISAESGAVSQAEQPRRKHRWRRR